MTPDEFKAAVATKFHELTGTTLSELDLDTFDFGRECGVSARIDERARYHAVRWSVEPQDEGLSAHLTDDNARTAAQLFADIAMRWRKKRAEAA